MLTWLEVHAYHYLMRHFVRVARESEELLQLPIESMQKLVGADELNVKNEELVWECILRWIDFEPNERKHHIVDLMRKIRLGLLNTQFFLEHVSCEN